MKNQEQVLKEQEQIKKISEKFEAMYEAGELMVPGKALCMNSAPESANAENAFARVVLARSVSENPVASMTANAEDYYVTGNCDNVYLYTYTYEGNYALSYVGRLYYNSSGSNSSNYCFQVYANYDSLVSSYGADNLNGVNLFLGTTSYSGSEPYYIYDYTSGEYLGYTVANNGMIGFYLKAIYEYTGQINFLVYHQPATPQMEIFYASEGYIEYLYNCLSSLTIQSMPTKMAYVEGESFDTSGLVVRANYLDGSYLNVPLSACTVSVSGFKNTGINLSVGTRQSQTVTVTIAYDQLTVSQTMSITMAPKFELNITKMPNELHYVKGQKFDATGMVVQALYHDGTTKEVTGYTCIPNTALEDDDRLITVTYTEDGLTKTKTLWVDVATVKEGYYGNRNISVSNYGENPIWNLQTMGMKYLQQGLSIGMNSYTIGANLVYDSQIKNRLQLLCKGMPNGWKLDAHQFVVKDGKDDNNVDTYKYIDGQGYVHTFERYNSSTNEYYDAEGVGLVLTVNNGYVIKDKNNNQMIFDSNGRLIQTVSGTNTTNIKNYQYDTNGRLFRIYDNRKTARYVFFEYDTDNLLMAIKTYENDTWFETLSITNTNGNITSITKTKNGVRDSKEISAFTYDDNGKLQLIANKETNNAAFVRYHFDSIRNDYSISQISRGIVDADNDFMEKTFERWTSTNTQNDFKTYCEICIENEKGVRIAHKMDSEGNMASSMEKISNYDYKTLEKDVGVKLSYASSSAAYKVNGESGLSLYSSTSTPNQISLNLADASNNLSESRYYNLSFWLNYYSENFDKLYACITYTVNGTNYTVYRPVDVKLIRVWQKITLPIDLQSTNGTFTSMKLTFVTFNENGMVTNQYISGYVSCFRLNPSASSKLKLGGKDFDGITKIVTVANNVPETIYVKATDHKFTESDYMRSVESYNRQRFDNNQTTWDFYYDNGKKRIRNCTEITISIGDTDYDFFTLASQPKQGNLNEYLWQLETISADGRVSSMQYQVYNSEGCLNIAKTKIGDGAESTTESQGHYQSWDKETTEKNGVTIKREYFDDGNIKKETLVGTDNSEILVYQASLDDTGEYIESEASRFDCKIYTYSDSFVLDKMERLCYNENIYRETYVYDDYKERLETLTAYESELNSTTGTQKAQHRLEYTGEGDFYKVWDGKTKYRFEQYKDQEYTMFDIYDGSRWRTMETQELDRDENKVFHGYWRTVDVETDAFVYTYDKYGKPISETCTTVGKDANGNDVTTTYTVAYNYTAGNESEAAWQLSTVVDGYSGRTYTYEYGKDGSTKSVGFDGFKVTKVNESEKEYAIGADNVKITEKVVQDTRPRVITHTFGDVETPIFDRYYTYDVFSRNTFKQALKSNNDEAKTFTKLSETERGYGNAHMLPLNETYRRGEAGAEVETYKAVYTYDDFGNAETVTHSGLVNGTVTYEYDVLGRLTKETTTGSTVLTNGNKSYAYDSNGRMLSFNGNTLTYDDRGRVETLGEIEFTYDNYGNRTKKQNYQTGAIFNYSWTRGRLLASVNTTTYTYDKDGIRTKKIVNGVTHEYFYDGNKLIAEKVGDDYFYFFYDESGVCGFRYKDINYEYVKNIFGDIIGIYNEYGTHVATYAYDAWGNMTYCNAGTDVAYINPFLYRGYYYDSESGLYYLMTRYYDTQIGRFISPDTPDYLAPDTIGGVDLYAYYRNNPIKYNNHRSQGYGSAGSVLPMTSENSSISSGNNASVLLNITEKLGGYSSLRTHTTSTLLNIRGVRVSYTQTKSIANTSGILYNFADANLMDETDISVGGGMNFGNWYVTELFYTSHFGYGTYTQITPYFSYNSVINSDGISLGIGYIDSKGDNHTYSLDLDWPTIGKVAVAVAIVLSPLDEIAIFLYSLGLLLAGA